MNYERMFTLATALGYTSPALSISLGAGCDGVAHRYRVVMSFGNCTSEIEYANTVEVGLGFIEALLEERLQGRLRERETDAAAMRAALNGGATASKDGG